MKVVIIDSELQAYALHMVQRYMGIAEIEELGYMAALVRAFKGAEDIPEAPEVVKIDGPVEVVVDVEDLEKFGGTD